MHQLAVAALMNTGVPLHQIEEEADWRDNRRRYVEPHELNNRDAYLCEHALGGLLRLRYAGVNDAGWYVFQIDQTSSSYHGSRIAVSADQVPQLLWLAR